MCSIELQDRIVKRYPILNIFNEIKDHSIYSTDIRVAKLLWLFVVQWKNFSDVFVAIVKGQKNCLQKQLGLKIDKFGLLRCYGRFLNGNIPTKTP